MRLIVKRWIKGFLVFGCGVGFVGICCAMYVGRQLVEPAHRTIGPPPDFLGGTSVQFPSRSGSRIHGWLTDGSGANGCILLLHGVRADRRSMADRAKFLRDHGYHTLCIDLQAHGESIGEHITMGHLESMDAAAGVAFLRERHPGLPVVVIGTSLGGAAALMADYTQPPEALVIEAVFADATTAVANRLEMRFGSPGRFLTPLLSCQFKPRLGIDPSILSPVVSAANRKLPVFVIYGTQDQHARPSEAQAIFEALRGPKEIWGIDGAAHVDFHGFARERYEQKVGTFIATHLHRPQAQNGANKLPQ